MTTDSNLTAAATPQECAPARRVLLVVESDPVRRRDFAQRCRPRTKSSRSSRGAGGAQERPPVLETASGLGEAAACLKRTRPDYALVSSRLAYGAITDVLRLILERSPACQILVVSNSPDEAAAARALSAGANGYLMEGALGGSLVSPELARCALVTLEARRSPGGA